jgi:GntR family transcriptional regulator/MocR family aminotransferase
MLRLAALSAPILLWQNPVVVKLDGIGRLHQQVYRALRGEILGGRLTSGERVPSTRDVAGLLKVSRNTALLAYEQLLAEGFITPRSGAAGTVVAHVLPPDGYVARPTRRPASTRPRPIDPSPTLAAAGERYVKSARACALELGVPSLTWEMTPPAIRYDFRPGRASFGDLPYALWRRLLNARARDAKVADLDYGPPAGRRELREAIAARLRRVRGLDADPGNIVIVNGTQQALDLISRVLLNPGDRVLMEEPHYTGARCAFMAAGAEMVFSPVDGHGIRIPAAAHARRQFRLAYVTPSHQFPTGAVLSMERRLRLIEWAARQGAFIVEDDYDGEYRYDGPPLQALTGMDRAGCTIYVGTFSKTLFPALRLGYLVLPTPLVEPIVATKAITDTGTPALAQLALADFIAEGHFDRYLRRTTASNAARRDALVAAIDGVFGDQAAVCGASAGLHLLVWLRGRRGGVIRDVHARAERAGVGLYTVDPFYATPPERTGILLGFAPLMPADIREGIRRLAGALK